MTPEELEWKATLNPQQQTYVFDKVIFDSCFDSGNIHRVEKVSDFEVSAIVNSV